MKIIKTLLITSLIVCSMHILSAPVKSQVYSGYSTNNTEQLLNEIGEFDEDAVVTPDEMPGEMPEEMIDEAQEGEKVRIDPVIEEKLSETNKNIPPATLKVDKNLIKKTPEKVKYFDHIWRSVLIPGFGQYVLGRKTKAIVIYSAFMISGAMGLYYHSKAEDKYQEYLKGSETIEVTQLYDDYLLQNQTSNTYFYITLGIWVYNIIDVLLDVSWMNADIAQNNKVTFDPNEKKVIFYVYKKSF